MIPQHIRRFVDAFARLPSIGPRQATRLAFHLAHMDKNELFELTTALAGLHDLHLCPTCFFVNEGTCAFCADPRRQSDVLCVVEKETDVMSLETTKTYTGLYLVLGPLGKTGALTNQQQLRLASLRPRAPFSEIILGISPTAYGDLNASLIFKEVQPLADTVTRLGRGIPTGGEIEFADPDTLRSALDNRT